MVLQGFCFWLITHLCLCSSFPLVSTTFSHLIEKECAIQYVNAGRSASSSSSASSSASSAASASSQSSSRAASSSAVEKQKHYCKKCNKSGGLVKITLRNGENEWFCAADFPPSLMTPAIQQMFAMRARDSQLLAAARRGTVTGASGSSSGGSPSVASSASPSPSTASSSPASSSLTRDKSSSTVLESRGCVFDFSIW